MSKKRSRRRPNLFVQVVGCLGAAFILVLLCIGIFSVVSIVGLGAVSDGAPDWLEEKAVEYFDVAYTDNPSLSEEDRKKIEEMGFDPSFVASSIRAVKWIHDTFQTKIDLGIVLSIHQHEGGGGKNMGNCPGIQAAMANPNLNEFAERAAAQRLLEWWKQNDVRSKNPIAAQYIYPDYSNYIGHCSAGEMGAGGFIPTTASTVCEGLKTSDDPEVHSCDFWSLEVEASGIVFWLHRIGYRADQDRNTKFNELYGWNHLASWRNLLLDTAKKINETANFDGIVVGDSRVYVNPDDELSILKGWLYEALVYFEILPDNLSRAIRPETQEWLAYPLKHEDYRGRANHDWGAIYPGIKYGPPGKHLGIDFRCTLGTDIVAIADGTVVDPANYAYKYDGQGWGWVIWIDHGGIVSMYGHLSKVTASYGSPIKKGDVLGECGATGNVTGPHLHFGVSLKHPDNFNTWYDPEAWVDPDLYLGKVNGEGADDQQEAQSQSEESNNKTPTPEPATEGTEGSLLETIEYTSYRKDEREIRSDDPLMIALSKAKSSLLLIIDELF
jgi:murein DD-endopeptidase MepM/ murein hydrolase activator NlpD